MSLPIPWSGEGYDARPLDERVPFRMQGPVQSDPKVQGGVPCFAGTRVPVESLFEHLRRGYTVDYFLAQFPTVSREQVDAVLEQAKRDAGKGPHRAAG